MAKEQGRKLIASNRKARHDYLIEDTFEAGLVLMGTEVKALRMGRASLVDGWAGFDGDELWLEGVHIPEYSNGTWNNHSPRRKRKLLLHRRELTKLLQAPFALHDRLVELIDREAVEAREGRPARIVAKMNALSEPRVIEALYRASQAGVSIDLIVRGICCLRPGVPGLSETIRVRSIIGRFLEHSRVYHFHAGGAELVYCASADWMQRNFFKRVEVAFPVEDPAAKARVLEEGLATYLRDDVRAWELLPDGRYRRLARHAELPPHSAQDTLLAALAGPPAT